MTRRFPLSLGGRSNRWARLLAALGSGVALGLSATTATAEPLYPWPDPDPFYSAPTDLAAHQPGDVLNARPLPPLPVFPGASVTLVQFRSSNSNGVPIAATTTVVTPAGHRPDAPLLSYQHFINALGTGCAVSHLLYSGDTNLLATVPMLNAVLAQGWSVALPDHLGPYFALGAARLGGHIVLDGVRAVKRMPELAAQNSRVVLAGYSGGGLASGWAAALQPTYAPELELAGAAVGGTPMNMETMADVLGFEPHPAFGLAMAAAIGLEREYPNRLPVSTYLNERGHEIGNAMANSCTAEILSIGTGGSAREFMNGDSIIDFDAARVILRENSLALYDGAPRTPVFEWHSPTDSLIPLDAIDQTNRRWCAAGVPVQTLQVPPSDHLTGAVLGAPEVLMWMEGRVRGEPAPSTC
ncbi:lipase family protein [Nocardia sp. 004]|uniref:lipase family protein n=1 Tax=Nocardia sp. 004 TaxID=3385978 RepID=UPI0039A0B14F